MAKRRKGKPLSAYATHKDWGYTCKVCGELISQEGATHYRCKRTKGLSIYAMQVRLSKAIREIRSNLHKTLPTKIWRKEDGEEKLKELFPDKVKD